MKKKDSDKIKVFYTPIKNPENFLRVHLALKRIFNEEDIIKYFDEQENKEIEIKNDS